MLTHVFVTIAVCHLYDIQILLSYMDILDGLIFDTVYEI